MGRRMMRALGAGLMEAGRQAELSRKEQLEQQRQQNLREIAEGRQGIMREQVGLMKDRLAGQQESDLRTETFGQIGKIQERLDAMRKPGDMYLAEYMTNRATLIKEGATSGMDVTEDLARIETEYKDRRAAELTPGTAEHAAWMKERDSYVKEVNGLLDSANRKMKMIPGWDGDIGQVLHFSSEYTDAGVEQDVETPPAEVPAEKQGLMSQFMHGSNEPSAVPGEGRKMGREYGALSAEGLGGVGRAIYGPSKMFPEGFDPYFKGVRAVSEGYQKYIGGPFERFMLGDPKYKGKPGLMEDDGTAGLRLKFDDEGNVITPGS
jgi:hypothetical protein